MSRKHTSSAGVELGDGESEELPVVCPHCLTRNALRQHFCRHCGTPLTNLAVTDPLGQVYSEGDAYRKGILNADRPIVLIGMWLIFGPTFFACITLLVWFVVSAFTIPLGPLSVGVIFAIILLPLVVGGMGLISGIILFRTTRNFRRTRAASRNDRHEP